MARRIIRGISFVGMPLGLQRRVIESVATIEELKDFRDLCIKSRKIAQEIRGKDYKDTKNLRNKHGQLAAKKSYYRKAWRTRYCMQMKPGLYKVCKNYSWYNYYETLNGGLGVVQNYYGSRKGSLMKNSLLMFSHHDEIGNAHFITCDDSRTIGFKQANSAIDYLERMPDA